MGRRFVARGFTLIELMVTIAVAGLLILLAAPSFQDMILMQRLRGVNAQLVTDMQLARAEAVARGRYVRVDFRTDPSGAQTCYSIYTAELSDPRCNCLHGAGTACPQLAGATEPGYVEIKTVSVQSSGGVRLRPPPPNGGTPPSFAFAFDFVTGGLLTSPTDVPMAPMASVLIESYVDDIRTLTTEVIQSGRPRVCSSSPGRMQVQTC